MFNRYRLISGLALGLFFSAAFLSADEYPGKYKLNSASNPLYEEECSACHLAYPPALLPQRSWQVIMDNLDKHFSENAEVDDKTAAELGRYLQQYAAEKSRDYLAQKFLRSIANNDTPLRISKVPYFLKEHHEMPQRMYKNNPKVKSLSQCETCHQQATQGNYHEEQINIPGFGAWED